MFQWICNRIAGFIVNAGRFIENFAKYAGLVVTYYTLTLMPIYVLYLAFTSCYAESFVFMIITLFCMYVNSVLGNESDTSQRGGRRY